MNELKLTGYVDRWSAQSGDRLRFFVSSVESQYRTRLVRLIHGDDAPSGPGLKEEAIESPLDAVHAGRQQHIHTGSCVLVPRLPGLGSFSLVFWIWPTHIGGRDQCLVAQYDPETARGYCVFLTTDGGLSLRGNGVLPDNEIAGLPNAATERQWTQVTVSMSDAGQWTLDCMDMAYSPNSPGRRNAAGMAKIDVPEYLVMGASHVITIGRSIRPQSCYDGKISSPMLFDRVLGSSRLDAMFRSDSEQVSASAVARWSFVEDAGTARVPDLSSNGHHAHTINRPGRLVTGHAYSGSSLGPHESPAEFNAIHFHDDDLADAGWDVSFEFTVPASLKSGIYAAKLMAGNHVDYIPFVVRRHASQTPAKVALLVPTVSYMAYANSHLDPSILPGDLVPLRNVDADLAAKRYILENHLHSLYDRHSDGSGVSTATMLRPIPITLRPGTRSSFNNSPHQLASDLYIIDWLEAKNIPYDVITDHDVDKSGVDVLGRHAVVLSGTHAEYWTGKMLDALALYKEGGGRFVYLSGNGLYWVTALSDDQTIAEVRRLHGTRSWSAEPGEAYISLSGEMGGLWRHRGRAPQSFVGVGFSAQGFDEGSPYRRLPASNDPRARFIFEGVSDEMIGEFPVLVSKYGAAGYEVDRADFALGTPRHALVVASATGLGNCYQNAIEEAEAMAPVYGGKSCSNVRADMVFFETPNNGAVFATGSIAWCSGLSYNGYDNSVSRITENVVKTFSRPGPLPVA